MFLKELEDKQRSGLKFNLHWESTKFLSFI